MPTPRVIITPVVCPNCSNEDGTLIELQFILYPDWTIYLCQVCAKTFTVKRTV